jgi:Ca-activated chloride channel homolog
VRRNPMAKAAEWTLLIGLTAICMCGQTSKPGSGRKICVVAVHDSSLFTLCPITQFQAFVAPDGTQRVLLPDHLMVTLPPSQVPLPGGRLDLARPDWPELALSHPGISPSGWMDPDLDKKIGKEFEKHKEYQLVDAPEKADLIFLVEAHCRTLQAQKMGAATVNVISFGDTGIGDRYIQAAMAIAVPAEAYRANPGNVEALLRTKLWEGSTFWYRSAGAPRSAPVETLVQQFIKKRKPSSDFPPVCAAWSLSRPATPDAEPDKKEAALRTYQPGLTLPTGAAAATASNAIKVDVTLVTVPVIASDMVGKFVSGLKAQDFHLYENGREQQIDRVVPDLEPFNVALMLDVSGSTIFKHTEIQSAALAFLEAMRPEDQVMVVAFSGFIQVESELTGNRDRLRQAILQTKVSGSTRLYDSLEMVVTQRLDRVPGRKAIVLLTDGVDTASRLTTLALSLERIEESNVLVYVLQYDTQSGLTRLAPNLGDSPARASEYLRGLSTNSGGRRFDADSIPALREAFLQIADELRHQYAICYYPAAQTPENAFRRIQVTVDRPDIKVRTRLGYRPALKR